MILYIGFMLFLRWFLSLKMMYFLSKVNKIFKKSNHFDEYWGISFLFIFRNLYIYIIGLSSCIFPISPLFSYHFFFFVIDWEGFVYGYFLLLFSIPFQFLLSPVFDMFSIISRYIRIFTGFPDVDGELVC